MPTKTARRPARKPVTRRNPRAPSKAALEKAEALADLKRIFPRGSTVYTILRSAAKSGLSRVVSVVAISDGYATHPNWAVSVALGLRAKRGGAHDGVTMQGGGMDMGWELSYRLGELLYNDGNALKHQWL